MIKNKQVNLWRGPDPPPTIYHIWLKDESQLLRYDEEEQQWLIFLDSKGLLQKFSQLIDAIDDLANFTVNGKDIKDDPVLDGSDILTAYDGNYIKRTDSLQKAVSILDKLLTTKVYNGQ